MKASIVFDIGGTFIRAGVYDNEEILHSIILKEMSPNFKMYSSSADLLNAFRKVLYNMCNTLEEQYKNMVLTDVGISFPGPIKDGKQILNAPTLWGNEVTNISIQDTFNDIFSNKNIHVINDITAAGWRYLDEERNNFCIITISSGVGCKVFKEGKALLGTNAIGGELGHVFYRGQYSHIKCDCGAKGHIGAISSGRGIENLAHFLSQQNQIEFKKSVLYNSELSTYDIVSAIKSEDEFAINILNESILPIADSITFFTLTIGISDFILVGGFFNAVRDKYMEILQSAIIKNGIMGMNDDDVKKMLHSGMNDDNNGLIGVGKYINNINKNAL